MSTDLSSSRQISIRDRATSLLNGTRLQELLGKGAKSSQPSLDPSIVLRDVLPLPGLREIGLTARALTINLQAMSQAQAECLAVAGRLQHMTELMKELAELDLDDFEHQLDEAKRIFDEGMGSGHIASRFQKARHKLEVCQNLDQRINDIVHAAQMQLLGRLVLNQEEGKMVKTILPQEINHQSDLPEGGCPICKPHAPPPPQDMEPQVICKRRSGNVGSIPVHYVTYRSEKSGVSRKTVNETLRVVLQLSHNHISSVVGKTSEFGCNGIVFTGGTLTFAEFFAQAGLRDAAKCVLEYISATRYLAQHNTRSLDAGLLQALRFRYLDVGSIQVRDNGSIVIIPETSTWPWMTHEEFLHVMVEQYSHNDLALRALAPCLSRMARSPTNTEERLLRTLATSNTHWNELQTLKLASNSDLSPARGLVADWIGDAAPPFIVSPFDTASMTKTRDWWYTKVQIRMLGNLEPLIPEPQNNLMHLQAHVRRFHPELRKLPQNNSEGWDTYLLPRDRAVGERARDGTSNRHPSWFNYDFYWFNPEGRIWSAFKQTAREHARSPTIPLTSIYLCIGVTMDITMERDIELSDTEELYFHRRPNRTSDPADFWGYLSTSPSVEYGAARSELEQRGWKMSYRLKCQWYGMKDDWEYRYETLLEEMIDKTPGSFASSSLTVQAQTEPPEDSGNAMILEVN